MKRNMGALDRLVRTFVVAPALTVLGLGVSQQGTLPSIVALALAVVMLVTSAVGFCPTYVLLGISTLPRDVDTRREVQVAP